MYFYSEIQQLFSYKKNPNLSRKRFNDFVIVYVYCSLCRCSDVAKGYRVEDQALEMDRKVGDSFWSTQEGGEKQTNKKGFKPLANLTCFALLLKIQLLIKKSKKKCHKKLNVFSPIRYHFHKRWGQVPYYAPGFNALHLNM